MYKIFVSAMGYDAGRSGISTYINESVQELVKDHKVDLLILKSDRSAFPVDNENLKFLEVPDYLGKAALNMLWHLFWVPFTRGLKKYDFCFLPAANRRLFCRYPTKTIATFHDLSQFNVEAKYDRLRMYYIKSLVPKYLRKVSRVLAVSENTKKDIIKHYGLREDLIEVNYNGFDSSRFQPLQKEEKRSFSRLEEKKEYILYVSRIEHPGKNHIKLVEAYEQLPEELKEKYNLVFAGQHWSGSEVVLERIRKSSDKNRIFVTGFVPHECLPELYREASLFVFPSLYEGFGFPLLETMACGVPAVCSNTASLPEIGKDAALTFDPQNAEDMKNKMERVLSDNTLMSNLKEKGLQRAQEFSWPNHISKIIRTYEAACGNS